MLNRRSAFALGLAWFALPAMGATDDEAQDAANKLVSAMGGRAAWLNAKGLIIEGVRDQADRADTFQNNIFMALDEPKMRLHSKGANFHRIRGMNGARGWIAREDGAFDLMTAAQLSADRDWWESHPYRNIRRLALGDNTRRPRIASDGRLELLLPDGRRLMWYKLDLNGEPVAFGSFEDDRGTLFGPLERREGGVRLPLWIADAAGAFRGQIRRALSLPTIPNVNYDAP